MNQYMRGELNGQSVYLMIANDAYASPLLERGFTYVPEDEIQHIGLGSSWQPGEADISQLNEMAAEVKEKRWLIMPDDKLRKSKGERKRNKVNRWR